MIDLYWNILGVVSSGIYLLTKQVIRFLPPQESEVLAVALVVERRAATGYHVLWPHDLGLDGEPVQWPPVFPPGEFFVGLLFVFALWLWVLDRNIDLSNRLAMGGLSSYL